MENPDIKIRKAHIISADDYGLVSEFCARPSIDPSADAEAERILAEVRAEGDAAVARYAARFDGLTAPPEKWAVTKAECAEAREQLDNETMLAIREAHKRVLAFAKAGIRKEWTMSTPRGGMVGEQFAPLARVGIYVPGGADVPEVVVCTPADSSGRLHPGVLFALELAGATEVYRIGGPQAIGAMAYGTRTIRRVLKIVGPGGPHVTAAKRRVYGEVALDMIAGPSEIAILADETATAEHVAADMLSQAEHGTGFEKTLLVTTAQRLADAVEKELPRQAARLARRESALRVLEKGTMIVSAANLDIGMDVCNLFAPEHLEIVTREPRIWAKKAVNAGAVFLGPWTPEAVGDYMAGPSHVLPTGGSARMFSGLTVDDFRKRISLVSFTRADLQDVLPAIRAFGKAEGLDAHTRSANIRFDKA